AQRVRDISLRSAKATLQFSKSLCQSKGKFQVRPGQLNPLPATVGSRNSHSYPTTRNRIYPRMSRSGSRLEFHLSLALEKVADVLRQRQLASPCFGKLTFELQVRVRLGTTCV